MTDQPKPPFPDKGLTPPGLESRMDPSPHYKAKDYRPADKLKGRVALITGGDSGIGRAVALLFAREGADVALVYLAEEQKDAEKLKVEIERVGGQVLLIPSDVKEYESCCEIVKKTLDHFGKLDILVNNAAYQKHRDSIEELSVEQFTTTFETNIFGYFFMCKAALPYLTEGSSIINTGSITGLEGSKALLDYSATKGAIHAFTKSLAQNLVDRGIRVNCVAPGPVWTPLNPAELSDEAIREFGSGTPVGRPAQPEEIAPSYVFFASNADSSYISGHVLPLLGGDTVAG